MQLKKHVTSMFEQENGSENAYQVSIHNLFINIYVNFSDT